LYFSLFLCTLFFSEVNIKGESMTTNQLLKPVTTKRDKNLCIGGCDTVELAEKYGTPLYVVDEQTLRSVCRDYKNAFKRYPHTKMMYASKALCNSAISRILASEGFGFDTVSLGEIYTVHKAGISLENVLSPNTSFSANSAK
jgi:diaminopimelate decarboxylase